jgi:DnaJ-class molecular chaperone
MIKVDMNKQLFFLLLFITYSIASAIHPDYFYTVLGVDNTASTAEISKAYKKLALKLHPDKNPNDPSATAKFQQIQTSHAVLSNEELRKEYDKNPELFDETGKKTPNFEFTITGRQYLALLGIGVTLTAGYILAHILVDYIGKKQRMKAAQIKLKNNRYNKSATVQHSL